MIAGIFQQVFERRGILIAVDFVFEYSLSIGYESDVDDSQCIQKIKQGSVSLNIR
jgi:hypothetical protein